MNNPSSNCIQFFDELVRISETLQRTKRKTRQRSAVRSEGSEVDGNGVMDGSDIPVAPNEGHPYVVDNTHYEDMLEEPVPSPHSKSYYTEIYPGAAQTYGKGQTFMDTFNADKYAAMRKENIYYPWASQPEWELASFLLRSSLSLAAIDQFLSLNIVSSCYYLVIQNCI